MSKQILPIFLVVVVDVLGLAIILPLLPFYAEKLGASPTIVGLLVSCYAACQLIAGPILGRLSDRYGRRPLLLISQIGTFFSFLLLAAANTLWLVFVARMIDGFTAGNLSLAQAYIADVSKPEERTRSFAAIGIAFGIGFLVGPAFSGYLAQFNYVYPILAAAALSGASIAATYFLLPDVPPVEGATRPKLIELGSYAAYFRDPMLGRRLWQFVGFTLSAAAFMSGFPLFAERRFTWHGHPFGAKEVGYVYGFVGLIGIFQQGFLIRPLTRRYGDSTLVAAGFIFPFLGSLGLAVAYDIPALLICVVVASFSNGVLRPALTSLITKAAGPAEQGSVLGLAQSVQSMSQIVAPFLGSLFIEHGQLAWWAVFVAAPNLIGLLMHRQAERAPTPQQP